MSNEIKNIRQIFYDFFKEKKHKILPSANLIPQDDPTLLFIGAGMVPMKNYFLGNEEPPAHRIVTSQICLRAGGKHNDLDNVGYTARHHTLFEMLGNFSFGDYYKQEAISFAWEFLTKILGIDKDKLLVTVYHTDRQAYDIWKNKINLSDDKIIRISTDDNFWSMGDVGPCGPCSEIFYDYGSQIKGGKPGTKDEDGDRYVEIWNLVFMQYNRDKDGKLHELSNPSIDTGMGLERITAIIEGKHNNFETSIFMPIIKASIEYSGKAYESKAKIAHNVIADHLRAVCFLIKDGIRPGNEGRDYVLRRIIRRAMKYAKSLSNQEYFLSEICYACIATLAPQYPELLLLKNDIIRIIRNEEKRFAHLLARGTNLLEEELHKLKDNRQLSGEVAFKLYDTFGFPIDLTIDSLKRIGKSVNIDEFDQLMQLQKKRAKAKQSFKNNMDDLVDRLDFVPPATDFLYDKIEERAKIIALWTDDDICVDEIANKTMGYMLLDRTTFYGESGGQVGDIGFVFGISDVGNVSQTNNSHKQIVNNSCQAKCQAKVIETIKIKQKYHLHRLEVTSGKLQVGDNVFVRINKENRRAITSNHSATHLLHSALRKHIGLSIAQKGSHVDANRLRFDFTHDGAVDPNILAIVEKEINLVIQNNTKVSIDICDIEKAKKMGAVAIFGEKYGDKVRVLTIGKNVSSIGAGADFILGIGTGVGLGSGTDLGTDDNILQNNNSQQKNIETQEAQEIQEVQGKKSLDANGFYSREFCGGTHVYATGDIGLFIITSESGVSAGIRRIEAITGMHAYDDVVKNRQQIKEISLLLKSKNITQRVCQLLENSKQANSKKNTSTAQFDFKTIKDNVADIIYCEIKDIETSLIRQKIDEQRNKNLKAICVVCLEKDAKISVFIGLGKDLIPQFDARKLIQNLSQSLGGKGGGGRQDFAQAGGKLPADFDLAIKQLQKTLL